ncbi:hypothetical protein VTN77DRAFT_6171 [Rasamsonia byssochlamydoides]|uniref:uncharacterized protein n=1 Tax=Rasamsonia byssochlamydoides TaxID=89139 RepID=UPI0037442D8D
MHWKGLRLATTDGNNGSKRYSSIFSTPGFRHSEHVPRSSPSATQLARRRSDSGPRPRTGDPESDALQPDITERLDEQTESADAPPETPTERQSLRRSRFNMLRFRHASDPQLSASYAQADPDAPPVPPLPMPPPPTIITTAPTNTSLEKSAQRKNKLKIPLSKKPSQEALAAGVASQSGAGNGKTDLSVQSSDSSQTIGPNLGPSRVSCEEPGRLSISSIRSGGTLHVSERDARFSESSRSDRSFGDRGPFQNISKSDASNSHKKFRMPRLKKNRGPLFPLPVKLPPPESSNSPSASEQGRQSPTITGDSTRRSSMDPNNPDPDRLSPIPSPSNSSARLSSPKAGHTAPPLSRKNSLTSARSVNSSSSAKGRRGPRRRGRSSTLNSLADIRNDEHQSSPNLASSGRTSTSTSGRKSFGDLFNFSQRLRQGSEPPVTRDGYPASRGPGTPASESKNGSSSRDIVSYPEREEGETPAAYLSRLQEAVPKGVIASILSKSDDEFYKVALRKYMRTFSFFGEPIDMAIRKLLMEVELPKETQQIDRVLQSFSDRYHECNPGIFASSDQAYFIAFSILILHTDVFNKNNKRKMQKQDYVKNSRVDGISEDILECFYENISYTPFIHVEDELNLSGRPLSKPRNALLKAASSDHLTRASKEPVDPYAIILDGKLDTLRPTLKDVMDLEDTYSFTGAGNPQDIEALHQAFSKSAILQIVSARSRPDAFMTPTSIDNPAESHPGLVDIKVVKVGLLWRKDPKKKRARSPWQEWGALLTSSQLYFFRDLNWTKSLMAQYESQHKRSSRTPVVFTPPVAEFKPDAIMSTSDAVALVDSSYKRHKHAFLLVRHNGLEEVFLANSEADMHDWLAKLNYAATFRTTGVPMKGTIGTRYEGQRRQISRVDSTASDHSSHHGDANTGIDPRLAEEMSAARRQLMEQRIAEANDKLSNCQRQLDDLLRNARHLQVLTPVNTRAREQVILAAGRMSAKLKWVRLDIWRTKCYKQVLSLDLGLEEKQAGDSQKRASYATTSKTVSSTQPSLGRLNSASSFTTAPEGNDAATGAPASPEEPRSPGNLASPTSPSDTRRASVSTAALSLGETMDRVPTPSTRPRKPEREPSVLSSRSKAEVSSMGSPGSRLVTNVDDGEELVLREAGLLGVDGSTNVSRLSDTVDEIDNEEKPADDKIEPRGRNRRSLQRSLRDPHHGPHYPRSKKGRDSGSGAVAQDNPPAGEGEVLSRKETKFTFHGKKASVVTFGPEWQNMSAEERLKLRKPTPSEEPKVSESNDANESIRSPSLNSGRPQSIRSASTATVRSSRFADNLSVATQIPEVPSLDGLKEPQAAIVSNDAKDDDIVAPSKSSNPAATAAKEDARGDDPIRATEDDAMPREEELAEHIATQEKTRHSPHEQAVSA